MRLGGLQKPSFLEEGFCRGVENQNLGPQRLFPHAALQRAVLDNDLEFIQPSGGAARRPLVRTRAQKPSDLSRGQTRFSLESQHSNRAQPRSCRRSIRINAKGRKAQQEARAPVEASHKGRKRRSSLSFGVENVKM